MSSPAYSVADASFRSLDPTQTGFHVWRIEKLELVAVPKESVGKFYCGDAYIIYSASNYGEGSGMGTKAQVSRGSRLEQHIHFWLGSESSQDESAVAAYKTVELDDFLGGAPIQHREVQGHESKRFLSYFKDGTRILQGGVASGLNHVTLDFTPKLYIVKGKRQPIVRQLKLIAWSEMNEGDVFVLDVGEFIFTWVGRQANRLEKLQGAKLAQKLKDENGKGTIVIVEDGNELDLSGKEREAFDQKLPIDKKQVKPATAVESDEKEDVRNRKEIRLYRCSDEDGTLCVTEVKEGPLFQTDLLSQDSFIVDNGNCGIWVWVGKRASKKERTEAMRNAQGFIKKKGYNSYTSVTRVVDGGESSEFKTLFKTWREKDQAIGMGAKYSAGRGIAKVVQTKFDAKTLHTQPSVAAECRMVDDGKGAKEVFRVDRFDLVQVPEDEVGKFYSGDCYVILYAYNNGSKDSYMIYFWLGSHSSQDEQGTAALKAVELDDRLGGQPVQVRVTQGKEPPHFMAIFNGKMTIFQGGIASAFEGARKVVEVGSTYLLQVHGRSPLSTKAVQMKLEAASLNTNDCFVLVSPNSVCVWLGKGSTGDEREMAKNIATDIGKDIQTVYEGQEKESFWSLIGGKGPYKDERILKNLGEEYTPRLFHGSNASGNFRLEEIIHFCQADLVIEDVMLLDVGDSVFIWLGQESNEVERRSSIESAKEYLEFDPSGRDQDLPIIVVKQGFEPPHFTGFFGAWDEGLFCVRGSSMASPLAMEQNEEHSNSTRVILSQEETTRANSEAMPIYDYSQLAQSEGLPNDVDPTKKEMYLSDQMFEDLFHLSKDQFKILPNWKRVALKKNVKLF